MENKKKNKYKKSLNIFWNIFQWILLICSLLFVATVAVFASHPPIKNSSGSLFGFETRFVISASMDAPNDYYKDKNYKIKNIEVGSVVFIKDVPVDKSKAKVESFYSTIKVNDVLTFFDYDASLTDGNIITHRVIDIKKENNRYLFICHGDAVDADQLQYVYQENVIGKVVGTSKFVGDFYKNFISNKVAVILCITIPSFAIIIYESVKIIKAVEDEKRSKKEKTEKLKEEEADKKIKELEDKLAKYEKNSRGKQ